MQPSTLKSQRPLSPHLQVYRPQITSVLSITHRATGFVLAIGSLVMALWLWGVAYSPSLYECLYTAFRHWLGQGALMLWSLCFYYHLANGLRHLWWDTGRGFALEEVTRTGLLVLFFTAAATVGTWLYVYGML